MWNWLAKLQECTAKNEPHVLATIIEYSGSSPREQGAKMVVTKNSIYGSIGGGKLEQTVIEEARKSIHEKGIKKLRIPLGAMVGQCCGGVVEVVLETFGIQSDLYIFGAGHVGQALVQTLVGTPFKIRLIDFRKEWIHAPEIPKEIICLEEEADDALSDIEWNSEKTFIIVMTHDHALDQSIIEKVIDKPTKYIGLIGSQSKWKRFKSRIMTEFEVLGKNFTGLDKVHCPIGEDIGGKTPKEISISIAAEILKKYYGK